MNKVVLQVMLPFTLILCLIILSSVMSGKSIVEHQFAQTEQIITLRQVGHELLRQSGDSSSRVLPIKRISDSEYQIEFEKQLTFQPDSLVSIVKRSLSLSRLTSDYIVTVLNCKGAQVIYGYAILRSEKKSIVPCSGRIQPKDCYLINVKFQDSGLISNKQKDLVFAGMPILLVVGYGVYVFKMLRKKRRAKAGKEIYLGETIFNAEGQFLLVETVKTDLTAKETKLLLIFARSPNEVIGRARLQKEIWEDEGVIVGRSLDMFISKLRKKLEHDKSLKLANVHGKGYCLEVSRTE